MSIDDEHAIDRLTASLRSLKQAYEKYFMGLERIEPLKEREAFKKSLQSLTQSPIHNSALRFRLQNLQASLISHEGYWNRITRQIEEGSYKRDRLRAERLIQQRQSPEQPADRDSGAVGEANDEDGSAGVASQIQPATPHAANAGAAKGGQPAKALSAIEQLHLAFEQTRQQVNPSAAPVSIDALAAAVRKQATAIKARYNCRSVEFRVAVKDGKPILKAIPK